MQTVTTIYDKMDDDDMPSSTTSLIPPNPVLYQVKVPQPVQIKEPTFYTKILGLNQQYKLIDNEEERNFFEYYGNIGVLMNRSYPHLLPEDSCYKHITKTQIQNEMQKDYTITKVIPFTKWNILRPLILADFVDPNKVIAHIMVYEYKNTNTDTESVFNDDFDSRVRSLPGLSMRIITTNQTVKFVDGKMIQSFTIVFISLHATRALQLLNSTMDTEEIIKNGKRKRIPLESQSNPTQRPQKQQIPKPEPEPESVPLVQQMDPMQYQQAREYQKFRENRISASFVKPNIIIGSDEEKKLKAQMVAGMLGIPLEPIDPEDDTGDNDAHYSRHQPVGGKNKPKGGLQIALNSIEKDLNEQKKLQEWGAKNHIELDQHSGLQYGSEDDMNDIESYVEHRPPPSATDRDTDHTYSSLMFQ